MRILIAIVLLPLIVFAKSNLHVSLRNAQEFHSKEELLNPLSGELVLGNKNANVKVVVFDSYSCVHCARFYTEIFPLLLEYIDSGKISFVHKEFPLDKRALFATKVVQCSKNKIETILQIYKNQSIILADKKYIESLLSLTKIDKKCVNNVNEKSIASRVFEYGKVLSIRGTPSVFVNSKEVKKLSKKQLIKEINILL
ncbi:MAG: protein-disulfide isomerase [Candidatus Deianiraeaceae bacterium]|jgi:protein-disulfide isomerase